MTRTVCPTLSVAAVLFRHREVGVQLRQIGQRDDLRARRQILADFDLADAEFAVERRAHQLLRDDRLGLGDAGIGLVVRRLRRDRRSPAGRTGATASCLARSSDSCATVACALKLARSPCSGRVEQLHQRRVRPSRWRPAVNMISVMRPLTSEVTLTWCTAARSPTAVNRFGITSDFASATLTAVGGGLLLAKNCAIIWPRK